MRRLRAGAFMVCLSVTILVTGTLIAFALLAPEGPQASGVVYLLGFLTMALAGCVLAGFRPDHPTGWVFVAGGNGTLLAAGLKGLVVDGVVEGTTAAWFGVL